MKHDFVIDSSVVISWLFEDEKTDASVNLLERIIYKNETCLAPSLVKFEVANAILMALQRKRINQDQSRKVLSFFDLLPIEIDEESHRLATKSVFTLSKKHSLTIYDASYLELALRMDIPIASFDRAMIKAAKAEKIQNILATFTNDR